MTITIELTAEQQAEIARNVAETLAAKEIAKARKPYSVAKFAEATGLSPDSIYRRIKAGKIRTADNNTPILIPASELNKFQ